MPPKPQRIPVNIRSARPRPVQDVAMAKKQAAQFPAVGMTLRNYQYDPRDQRRRSAGSPNVVKQSWRQRLRHRLTLKRTVITLAIIVLAVGGWVGGKFAYNAHKLFGGNLLSVLTTTKLKGEGNGRVNILLAGNSADDAGHSGGDLTDSVMLVSIDTVNNKAFLLSIPRDLWVHVPGDGHAKINYVYVAGKNNNFSADGYPNGGMGALEQTVSQDLGIPIDYYALVNYRAFQQAVDSVGGIDLNIRSNDPRGLYDPNIDWTTKGPLVKLTNGAHHLGGQQALDLARARGDAYNSYGFAGSDFDRTDHQRQMMVALKSKAISAGVLANPAKLSSLTDAIGNNVQTDFKLNEVHRLYDVTKKIDNSNIQSLSLNDANGISLLGSYAAPGGQSALIPAAGLDDFSGIKAFIKRQTSSDPIVQEGANVVVLNGSSINGLATKTKTQLGSKNVFVSKIGDAAVATQSTTTIIDNSVGKKPVTSAALIRLFGNHLTTVNPYASLYRADFIIVLGTDQASKIINGSSKPSP